MNRTSARVATFIVRALTLTTLTLATLASNVGCHSMTVPHTPYTAMLHREGQGAISGGVGVNGSGAPAFAVRGQYAVVRNFQVLGALHFDPVIFERDFDTAHVAGEVGIGTYMEQPSWGSRFELVAGAGFGFTEGKTSKALNAYATGTYLRPFLQITLGDGIGPYEQGFGLRLAGTFLSPSTAGVGDKKQFTIGFIYVFRVAVTPNFAIETSEALELNLGDRYVSEEWAAIASLNFVVNFDTVHDGRPEPMRMRRFR